METIQYLEQRIDEAQALLADMEGRDDFASRLSRQSMEHHVSDLQQQLRTAKAEREKEVIELNLEGQIAREGSLPLRVLGDIANYLSRSLHAASYYLRSGKELVARTPADIKHLMDLRLADLQPGSTRIFVTGNLSPDLFGRSLLEDSLNGAFQLLNADSEDELEDAVSIIGIQSVRRLGDLLKTLDDAGLEAAVTWDTPQGECRRWDGDTRSIRRISQTLKRLSVGTPEYVTVQGQLVTLSLKGQFEIRAEVETHTRTYKGTFPSRLLDDVKRFHK